MKFWVLNSTPDTQVRPGLHHESQAELPPFPVYLHCIKMAARSDGQNSEAAPARHLHQTRNRLGAYPV